MASGDNLRAGSEAGDAGRREGGKVRAARENGALRTWPCRHCECFGYTTKAQCWGHRGFAAVMRDNPTALHSLEGKIKRTGREDSREQWRRRR